MRGTCGQPLRIKRIQDAAEKLIVAVCWTSAPQVGTDLQVSEGGERPAVAQRATGGGAGHQWRGRHRRRPPWVRCCAAVARIAEALNALVT